MKRPLACALCLCGWWIDGWKVFAFGEVCSDDREVKTSSPAKAPRRKGIVFFASLRENSFPIS